MFLHNHSLTIRQNMHPRCMANMWLMLVCHSVQFSSPAIRATLRLRRTHEAAFHSQFRSRGVLDILNMENS